MPVISKKTAAFEANCVKFTAAMQTHTVSNKYLAPGLWGTTRAISAVAELLLSELKLYPSLVRV